MFPQCNADLMAAVNKLLPAAGGIGSNTVKGRQSTSALSPSFLTTLSEQAAARNNQG
jgi:hypothetical protein